MNNVGEYYGDNGVITEYVNSDEKIMTMAIIAEDNFGVARTYVFNRQHHSEDLRLELIELTQPDNGKY